MKIATQLIKEFWLPLVLSILWVLYNIFSSEGSAEWDIKKVVNIFGPTFFLLSWLTGQFFRVKKQTTVEDQFSTIISRVNNLFTNLEEKTNEMVNHISGGNSFPWLQIAMIDSENDSGHLIANHEGNYPLYDVTAQIADLNKFSAMQGNHSLATLSITHTNVEIGSLIPGHSALIRSWAIDHTPEQNYNVFMTARNGRFTQKIRMKKINGKWLSAISVSNGNGDTLYEQIDSAYPRNNLGYVEW